MYPERPQCSLVEGYPQFFHFGLVEIDTKSWIFAFVPFARCQSLVSVDSVAKSAAEAVCLFDHYFLSHHFEELKNFHLGWAKFSHRSFLRCGFIA